MHRLAASLTLLCAFALPATAQSAKPAGPYQQGLAHHAAGRTEQAIASYSQALATNPRNVNAYINRGVCLHGAGRHKEALNDYSRAAALDPTSALAMSNRGLVWMAVGQHQRALADFTRAITMSQPKGDWHFNRGAAHQGAGDLAAALREYDLAIGQDEVYAEAHFNRGTVLHKQGDSKAARAAYEAAVKHATPRVEKPAETPKVDADKVRALIKALGSAAWKDRDKATKALIAIGKPALPLLAEALKDKDLEVRNRAQQVIDKLSGGGKVAAGRLRNAPSTLTAARQALADLGTSPSKVATPIAARPEPADLALMAKLTK